MSFQLMTILEDGRNSLITIDHGSLLYDDAQGMVEYVSKRFCTMLQKRL
jgi:hypothetical protein